jgi:hypothetical protein
MLPPIKAEGSVGVDHDIVEFAMESIRRLVEMGSFPFTTGTPHDDFPQLRAEQREPCSPWGIFNCRELAEKLTPHLELQLE